MTEAKHLLNKVLNNIAKEQHFIDFDLKVQPLSSGGANYSSTLYNVKITEGDNVLDLFVKIASLGEQMRTQAPKVYDTEIFVYTQLAKVYERLEDEHKVPKEHRLTFSKFYGCNPTQYEETIVLENLAEKGYEVHDRFKSIDWKYAKSAMREIAKMHALSFAYDEYHPEDYKKVVAERQNEWNQGEHMSSFCNMMIQKSIQIDRKETKERLQKFFVGFSMERFADYYKCTKRPVLAHGDFKASNLMHRIRDVS